MPLPEASCRSPRHRAAPRGIVPLPDASRIGPRPRDVRIILLITRVFLSANSMSVALYLFFGAECRFSLGSRVPRLGCVGPVVPGGLGVLVVCCPARRVRDYPGGSGRRGGSGTPWGPRSTRQAISTRLSAGPGAGGAPGPQGEQEPGGHGVQGHGRGGRLAGRGRFAGRGRRLRGHDGAHGGLWFQAGRTCPGYLTGALAPSAGAPGGRKPGRRPSRDAARPAAARRDVASHPDRRLDPEREDDDRPSSLGRPPHQVIASDSEIQGPGSRWCGPAQPGIRPARPAGPRTRRRRRARDPAWCPGRSGV